jgi:hypothetical protein
MHALLTAHRPTRAPVPPPSRGERRRLARCDAVAARLAELHAIDDLLSEAAAVIGSGWVQNAWFAVATPRGERLLTAHQVRQVYVYPVTGACLAGSIVLAAGGPDLAATQLVQRTLDLTWHALHDDLEPPAVLCPSPPVRALRLLDLTRWNDTAGRSRADVTDLLGAARDLVKLQTTFTHRAQQHTSGSSPPVCRATTGPNAAI